MSEKLAEIRKEIDAIDNALIKAFEKRMELSDRVAEVKGKENIAISDESREDTVVKQALGLINDELYSEGTTFMRTLIALSKSRQRKKLVDMEETLLPPSQKHEPAQGVRLKVAYQGVPGAFTEEALLKYFEDVDAVATETFESVFVEVKEKRAAYGVVPIENSHTGAIGEVYDLLRKYGCYIVGQTWLGVSQCIMAKPGTSLADVREVLSHPQGFKQCSEFIKGKAWDLIACQNTAMAAQNVAASEGNRQAAIGSKRAASLNGLNVLQEGIMNATNNKTRFIIISHAPEYDASSNIVSIAFITAHRSGALCDVLFPLMGYGVNMSRIESRPMSEGKYCFFADLQGNITDPQIKSAIAHANASSLYLEVLGCYSEKVS